MLISNGVKHPVLFTPLQKIKKFSTHSKVNIRSLMNESKIDIDNALGIFFKELKNIEWPFVEVLFKIFFLSNIYLGVFGNHGKPLYAERTALT